MKKSFGILMTFLILLISMQQGIIFIHFKLNQDEIETKYCVNKDQPELECHGKCQLKKEIEQTTDDNKLEFLSIYKEIKLIKTDFFEYSIPLGSLLSLEKEKIFQQPNFYQLAYYFQNLKPPIV